MKANKEMRIFLLISYGVPILLSIFMWIAHQNNLNCNAYYMDVSSCGRCYGGKEMQ